MKHLIYCKEHNRSFDHVRSNPAWSRVSDINLHLWGAQNVPVEKCRELAKKIATGESDFPASEPLPRSGS